MPNTKERRIKDQNAEREALPSSPGDNPVELTPKDISPENATARDLRERPIASPDPEVREEALLDDAIDDTFPASDPIALSSYAETITREKAPKGKAGSRRPNSRA